MRLHCLHRAFVLLALVLGLATAPRVSHAWNTNGTAVCLAFEYQYNVRMVPDGEDGAILVWLDRRNPFNRAYAQRVSASGDRLWASNGIPVGTPIRSQLEPVIASDGAGGAIIAWTDDGGDDDDIFVQRVRADGTVMWADSGVSAAVVPGYQEAPSIISDGVGGAIVLWQDPAHGGDLYAQRVDGSGTALWGSTGVPVCTEPDEQAFPSMVPDGAQGVIVTWHDFRNHQRYDVYAQHLNSLGVAQWDSSGLVVSAAARDQTEPVATTDGAGGAIIAWSDSRSDSGRAVYAQHVSADGVPQWTPDGVPLCSHQQNESHLAIVPDDAGGAIVIRQELPHNFGFFDLYAQRVDASGALLFGPQGVPIASGPGDQSYPAATSDGAGGVVVTWMDTRDPGGDNIYAQRMSSLGVTQWLADGVLLCGAPNYQLYPAIVPHQSGGAIVAWQDFRSGGYDIYAQRVHAYGQVTAVLPGRPAPFEMLALHPNPTRQGTEIAFDLPVAQDVTIGVYDLGGRRIRNLATDRSFSAGRQSLIWDGASDAGTPVGAGIYFVRVKTAGAAIARRLAIVR